MRITGTVVLLLIAGILNFSNAQSDETIMETVCKKNGGSEAYDGFLIGAENFVTCLNKQPIISSDNNETIDTKLAQHCVEIGIFGNCIAPFAESVKPCVAPTLRELISIGVNGTAVILQSPDVSRRLVRDILSSTDRSCLPSKLEALGTCTNNFFWDDRQGSNTTTSNPQSAKDVEMCGVIRTFEQSCVAPLTECTDQIYATVLQDLFKYINNRFFCESLPKLQIPEPLPCRDVHVVDLVPAITP